VGRFLAYLDDEGLADNSIVLFLSDNGPVTTDWRAWWEINLYGDTGGLRGRKADLYEGGIRVPGIIRFPGQIEPGSTSEIPVAGYDIAPTLAKLSGIQMPTDRPIDGVDISPLFAGKEPKRETPLFFAFPATDGGPNYAAVTQDWKLTADAEGTPTALYRLKDEPYEFVNRLAVEPEVAAALAEQLHVYIKDLESDPITPDWGVEWKAQ